MGTRNATSQHEGVRAGSKSSIEIDFYYHGKRCKPRIKAQPTTANLRRAAAFRCDIIEAIENDTFVWSDSFPDIPDPFNDHLVTIPKLGEYLKAWLDTNAQYFAASTYNGYEKIINGHLIPAFGTLELYELRIKHVKDYVNTLTSSTKTIGNIISPLRAALDDAVHDELIDENPITNYKIKRRRGMAKKRNHNIDPFTYDERNAILNALTGQARNFVQFAFWTGLRTSEIIALEWSDIDFISGQIYINKALTQAADEAEETKTTTSDRKVKLFPDALDALLKQKQHTFLNDKEIFNNPRTNEPWTGDQPIRKTMWTPALKKAGVRYRRPYNTRHSYASMLLTDGERIQWVANQLGHADWAFTARTYAAYMEDDDPQAGNRTVEANNERKAKQG